MSTKNQEYWRRRAKQNEKDWERRCRETIEKRLGRYYSSALKAIRDDILKLYGEFAKENGMDFDEARRFLSSREFREWRMYMQDYLQKISGGDKGLSRELSEFEARLRITRLEKLYAETLQELDKLGRNVDESLRNFLSDAYTENYQRNIFDFVKNGGLSVAIAKVDSHDVSRILASKWSGKSFSKRVWNNTTLLSRNIRTVIANGVHRGLSIQQMSQMIEDKMHAGYSNAVRLVRTEMNFVNNQAHYDSMKDAGVEYYQFMAVLDNRTSQRCRALDGEIFPLEERDVGANYPPMHARCRSTVAPFIEGVSRRGTRVAKDKGGRNIEIPAAMTYQDYESVYVRKEKTLEAWKIQSGDLSKGLAASDIGSFNADLSKPIRLGEITDRKLVRATLEYFEKQIANYNVENAIIIYELNRNAIDIDEMLSVMDTDEFSARHNKVIDEAKQLGVGYRRWKRE